MTKNEGEWEREKDEKEYKSYWEYESYKAQSFFEKEKKAFYSN